VCVFFWVIHTTQGCTRCDDRALLRYYYYSPGNGLRSDSNWVSIRNIIKIQKAKFWSTKRNSDQTQNTMHRRSCGRKKKTLWLHCCSTAVALFFFSSNRTALVLFPPSGRRLLWRCRRLLLWRRGRVRTACDRTRLVLAELKLMMQSITRFVIDLI
jgi:hypothetical protein